MPVQTTNGPAVTQDVANSGAAGAGGHGIHCGTDPAIVTNAAVLAFYEYWLRLRGGRRFPARADIDPVHIPRHLSGILLLDVHYDPLDFEYRILGEEVIARLGDLTGRRVRQTALINITSSAYRNYCAVVESGLPQFLEGEAVPAVRSDRPYLMSRVHCPLSSDGATVDKIISYVSFLERSARRPRPGDGAR
ncbi:MAG TPA: PAS domain-containing protein [Alphaproteobacteria bacterium]|nr:PAS domain-containing protein [Alphaproteobacteria bacterium]